MVCTTRNRKILLAERYRKKRGWTTLFSHLPENFWCHFIRATACCKQLARLWPLKLL